MLWLTFSDHAELHQLLHDYSYFGLQYKKGAMECAAVRPCVIERDIVQINSTDLNIAG